MRESIKRTITLTGRNVKEIMRDPLSLAFTIAMPLFMEIVFYFIFHNLTDQFAMKYLAPGIVVFSQSFLSLFVGLLIAVDRGTAFLTRLYVSKAKSYEFIFGYMLAVLPLAVIQSILFFIVGGIIDNGVFSVNMIYSILVSYVTSAFFIGFGLLLGSVCNEKAIGGVASIVIAGQSVLSGMWFPKEGLSGGMITVMKCLPFKNATDLVQNVLTGINNVIDDFVIPFVVVLAYTIVVLTIAVIAFRRKMKA